MEAEEVVRSLLHDQSAEFTDAEQVVLTCVVHGLRVGCSLWRTARWSVAAIWLWRRLLVSPVVVVWRTVAATSIVLLRLRARRAVRAEGGC